jgi:SAP domain
MDSLFSASDLREELQCKGILYVTSANRIWAPKLWTVMEMNLAKLHFRLFHDGTTMIYCLRGKKTGFFRSFTNAFTVRGQPLLRGDIAAEKPLSQQGARVLAGLSDLDLRSLASLCGKSSDGDKKLLVKNISGHGLIQLAMAAAHVPPTEGATIRLCGADYDAAGLHNLPAAALQDHCSKLNLRNNGTKPVLIQRLLQYAKVQRRPYESTKAKVDKYAADAIKFDAGTPPPQHTAYKENFNGIDNHDQALGYLNSLKFQDFEGRLAHIFLLKSLINAWSVYCEYDCFMTRGMPSADSQSARRNLPTTAAFAETVVQHLVDLSSKN